MNNISLESSKELSLLKKVELIVMFYLMSATPIPRTMMMSIYGDMDTQDLKKNLKIDKKF